jgi:hypothetical protein
MTTLSVKLTDEIQNVDRQMRDTKNFIRTPFVQKLVTSLEYLAGKHELYSDIYLHAGSLNIMLVARNLTGLKDEKLAALLNSIIHHEPESTSNYDYPLNFTREFSFSWNDKTPGSQSTVRVTVTANFKEDSETCRRIVVGFKAPSTEPTPIYELRCEDQDQ